VYNFARENNVSQWQIYALPDEKLIQYYKNFGFKIVNIIYKGNELKVYKMVKEIEPIIKREDIYEKVTN
jgi:hypothetical protein